MNRKINHSVEVYCIILSKVCPEPAQLFYVVASTLYTAQELEEKVWDKAIEFGILTQAMKDKEGKRGAANAMKRSNVSSLSFVDGKAYFGYVRPEEAPSGAYYDLSFVIFPQQESGRFVVSIGVGSAGYQRDYDVASTDGTRRMFTRLTENDGNSFLKTTMDDRMVYDLMPLIKDYLAEGLMRKAADSFAQLFYKETGKYLYE